MHRPLHSTRLIRRSAILALLAGCAVALLSGGLGAGGAAGQDYTLPTTTTTTTVVRPFPKLDPFPLVRVVGRATTRGARITSLTVTAEGGTLVLAVCSGSRCPFRKPRSKKIPGASDSVRKIHVTSLERIFRSGVTLRLYAMKKLFTGKYTTFRIRRNKPPLRSDRCVSDFDTTPVACPKG